MVELKEGEVYFDSMRVGTSTFGRVCQIIRIEGDKISVSYIADGCESTMFRTAAGHFQPYEIKDVEAERDKLRNILGNFEAFLQK